MTRTAPPEAGKTPEGPTEAAPAAALHVGTSNVRELFTRNLRQSGIYIAFVVIVALFAILTDGLSLNPTNVTNIVLQYSYVLILDEPTRGIDVGAKYEIYLIINRLVAAGKAVVVISSELPELLGTCDRIYTLSAGRITGETPVADATQENLMVLMTKERESVG